MVLPPEFWPLVEMMQAYFPAGLFDGLPVALIRMLAGDQCGDVLGLPPSDWTKTLIDAGAVIDQFIPRADPRSPRRIAHGSQHPGVTR